MFGLYEEPGRTGQVQEELPGASPGYLGHNGRPPETLGQWALRKADEILEWIMPPKER